jgi:hypothetical protein
VTQLIDELRSFIGMLNPKLTAGLPAVEYT